MVSRVDVVAVHAGGGAITPPLALYRLSKDRPHPVYGLMPILTRLNPKSKRGLHKTPSGNYSTQAIAEINIMEGV